MFGYITFLQSYIGTGVIYQLMATALLFIIFLGIIRIVNKSIDALTSELTAGKSSYTYRKAIVHYSQPLKLAVKVLFGIIFLTIMLSVWGLTNAVLGMLSAAGFLGLILGFAAKDIISDFIAGIVIFIDKPFMLGDWIEVAGVQGKVMDMKLASTRVRTFDGELVTIPNTMVSREKVVNRTHQGLLRIKAPISIDYKSNIDKAMKLATNFMIKHPLYLESPKPTVLVTELAESGVTLEMRCWINPSKTRRKQAIHTLLKEVKAIYDKNKIKIPFKQVEISKRK